MQKPVIAIATCCVLLLAACGGGDDDDVESTATTPATGSPSITTPGGTLEWSDCGGIECATLEVPADRANPDLGSLELALGRRPADGDAIGSLLVNPGGPGAAGIPIVEDAEAYFTDELLDRFDIVAWDPRGTGDSTAIDCGNDLDYFFATDKSPDDDEEVQENLDAARRFAGDCKAGSGDLLANLSSSATVDDMDAIRVALGEEKLTYLGFSYGTYLGAQYADRYPQNVRALVLDGAVDPSLPFEQYTREQAQGFDAALAAFLDDCERSDCGFGGSDPRRAYDRLIAQIDAETLPGEIDGEARELGPGEADIGIASALYAGTDGWDILADALSEAAGGDASTLLRLSDIYTGRTTGGTYDNSQPAFFGIGCVDAPAPTAQELPTLAARVAQAAPDFGASTTWLSSPCSVWPVAAVGAPAPVQGAGAPPIVVLGTTNDPATPLRWAEGLAAQLESARLVVFEGEGHTAFNRGSDCVDDAVESYLVDLEPPADGLTC